MSVKSSTFKVKIPFEITRVYDEGKDITTVSIKGLSYNIQGIGVKGCWIKEEIAYAIQMMCRDGNLDKAQEALAGYLTPVD